VTEHFVPVRIHIQERPQDFKRFGAGWTPTVVITEPDGTERHRSVGFVAADDLLAQLQLGIAKVAYSREQFKDAQNAFQAVVERHPKADAAPEALYWQFVSAYKATGNVDFLKQARAALQSKYPEGEWAKKASVWGS
jgi:hypothetical protein